VFGDGRVCGTREQRILQVDLVRRRARAGIDWDSFFNQSFIMFWINCNNIHY